MAYSELIKNFNRIRDYMREFYVYGFKSREEYTKKSARSYDDERRRLESWLGEYMQFHHTVDGKNVFISIDSRFTKHNPLYKAWKTKSFTDGDITLHFILMDIFADSEDKLTLSDITHRLDNYLSQFTQPRLFDESTIRKKLNEYISEGIIKSEKIGRVMFYQRSDILPLPDIDMLNFFSEIAPCGVIGSFMLDKYDNDEGHFSFKHHYITNTMDSEILCSIFNAMREKRGIIIKVINRHKDKITENYVIPLRIMISVQNGRQYLMSYIPRFQRITSFRIDNIVSVKMAELSKEFDELRAILKGMLPNMWGVSTDSRSGNRIEHVEFTVCYTDTEQHIPRRLEREKRCGTIEHLDKNTSRFSADVYDSSEVIPWIRTFICRITDVNFSNKELEKQFKDDMKKMYLMYGLEGDENNDIQ